MDSQAACGVLESTDRNNVRCNALAALPLTLFMISTPSIRSLYTSLTDRPRMATDTTASPPGNRCIERVQPIACGGERKPGTRRFLDRDSRATIRAIEANSIANMRGTSFMKPSVPTGCDRNSVAPSSSNAVRRSSRTCNTPLDPRNRRLRRAVEDDDHAEIETCFAAA